MTNKVFPTSCTITDIQQLDPLSANLTKDEAAADATLIVVGATDTSVQTVLTFLRYLSVEKTARRRLQEELRDVFNGDIDDVDVSALMRLPYLDACVQESLRIMPPGPFGRVIFMIRVQHPCSSLLPRASTFFRSHGCSH